MLDVISLLLEWFNNFAQKMLKLFQTVYHDVYKEEKDFGAAEEEAAEVEGE